MELGIKYRGKVATTEDVAFINQLIFDNPNESRWRLSRRLCEAWNWVQPNGTIRDMVARGFMLELHRAGYIQLPPLKRRILNPFENRREPLHIEIDQKPLHASLNQIRPLEFRQVRRSASEKLFNSLMNAHHYLGYIQPVGEHLKYMVYANQEPIACLAWSSAPWHIGARDRFIGWSAEERKKNISFIAYNTRFLILPWVRVPHLASHILGCMAKILSSDWEKFYRHPVYYLETFVDKERFKGTCYYAANWIYLGDTTGRGKNDQTNKPNRSIKAVLGYPLTKAFRRYLTGRVR